MMRSAFEVVSACASVLATTKSTPCRPLVIMLLTALPPAPPVPNTVIRGLSSRISGIFRLMVMAAPFLRARRRSCGAGGRLRRERGDGFGHARIGDELKTDPFPDPVGVAPIRLIRTTPAERPLRPPP